MKKIIVFAACALSMSLMAQDYKTDSIKPASSYCVKLQDGIMVLLSKSGKQLTNNVVLPNGTEVSVSGVIKTKDGLVQQMNEGECIDLGSSTAIVSPKQGTTRPQANENK